MDDFSLVPNPIISILYNTLLKLQWLSRYHTLGRRWWRIWKWSVKKYPVPVKTTIHNHHVLVNNGYAYPMTARKYKTFNNPLVELVYQSYKVKNRPVNLIDVGAAIGDTVLLISENCPKMLGHIVCIDGDKEFFRYLEHNLDWMEQISLIEAMLSSEIGAEKELIHIHAGTASAQGKTFSVATTLDKLSEQINLQEIDIIKIDVDGFDGKVLQGGRALLRKYSPEVIFEWHPILYRKTGNDWLVPFEELTSAGYDRFLWFDKFGNFCLFSGLNVKSINTFAELCFNGKFQPDWHYDIVALHRTSPIIEVQLAELSFARQKKSQF